MTSRFLAIVNPAAGGGKCGRLADAALERVRGAGIELDVARTNRRRRGDRSWLEARIGEVCGNFSLWEATGLRLKL